MHSEPHAQPTGRLPPFPGTEFGLPLVHAGYQPHAGHDDPQNSQQQLLDLLSAIQSGSAAGVLPPQQHAFSQFREGSFSAAGSTPYAPSEHMHASVNHASNEMATDYRGGSTGSTSFSVDSTWDDSEFAFTPLVSPAMTPLSALLSPQVQSLKNANGPNAHVSPAEVFTPLTSPALQPQDAQMMGSPHLAQLAEQASSLGLDNFQLPRPHGVSSPSMQASHPASSAAGPARGRGRMTNKSRPSPILKAAGRPARASGSATPAAAAHTLDPALPSTPSPIDIDVSMAVAHAQDLMPPPPLPPHASLPATPSSMMNLGPEISHANGFHQDQQHIMADMMDPISSPTLGPKRGSRRQSSKGGRSNRNSVDFAPLPASMMIAPEERRNSHRAAEQRRRDSLKLCFEELRPLLPHIPPEEDEEALASKRPGEGNVAGQRTSGVDPQHPNKGVSKVALLRKSNLYIAALERRIQARDAILLKLKTRFNVADEDLLTDDWEEEWPWNGRPGDEGHSPYSAAAMAAAAKDKDGDLNGSRRSTSTSMVTRTRARRDSIQLDQVADG